MEYCEYCGRPKVRDPKGSKSARAYALRAEGLAWTEIARRVGWANGGGACTAAQYYAKAKNRNLPWPPEQET